MQRRTRLVRYDLITAATVHWNMDAGDPRVGGSRVVSSIVHVLKSGGQWVGRWMSAVHAKRSTTASNLSEKPSSTRHIQLASVKPTGHHEQLRLASQLLDLDKCRDRPSPFYR